MHRVVAYGQNRSKRRTGCSGICGISGNGAFKTACAYTLLKVSSTISQCFATANRNGFPMIVTEKRRDQKPRLFSLEIRVHANKPCNLALWYASPPVRFLSRVHL